MSIKTIGLFMILTVASSDKGDNILNQEVEPRNGSENSNRQIGRLSVSGFMNKAKQDESVNSIFTKGTPNTYTNSFDPFSPWSSWSKCSHKCQQRRRKKCSVTWLCARDLQTEVRVCPHCDHVSFHIIQPQELTFEKPDISNYAQSTHRTPQLKNSPLEQLPQISLRVLLNYNSMFYTSWTPWNSCSATCLTNRYRSCRYQLFCGSSVIQEEAYCYVKGSACEKWFNRYRHNKVSHDSSLILNQYSTIQMNEIKPPHGYSNDLVGDSTVLGLNLNSHRFQSESKPNSLNGVWSSSTKDERMQYSNKNQIHSNSQQYSMMFNSNSHTDENKAPIAHATNNSNNLHLNDEILNSNYNSLKDSVVSSSSLDSKWVNNRSPANNMMNHHSYNSVINSNHTVSPLQNTVSRNSNPKVSNTNAYPNFDESSTFTTNITYDTKDSEHSKEHNKFESAVGVPSKIINYDIQNLNVPSMRNVKQNKKENIRNWKSTNNYKIRDSPFWRRIHALPKSCGQPSLSPVNKGIKILGGKEAHKGAWPWQVAILNRFKEAFCGGTVIADQWVVTAAHCLRKNLIVRLAEHDLAITEGTEVEFKIAESIAHPLYDPSTVDNDVALLRLPKSLLIRKGNIMPKNVRSWEGIMPACVPSQGEPLPTGQQCTIVGWGKARNGHYFGTDVLHQAKVPIVSPEKCRTVYHDYYITQNMFCAGHTRGRIDSCAGDSGGPLLCFKNKRWYLYGITSFGEGCGKSGKYGIYVKVSNYRTWINDVIAAHSYKNVKEKHSGSSHKGRNGQYGHKTGFSNQLTSNRYKPNFEPNHKYRHKNL